MNDHKIVITSDSTCDLGENLISARGIGIMPLTVTLGEKSFKDGIDIVPDDIFAYVEKSGELPKTAAPSVEDYETFLPVTSTREKRSFTSISRQRRPVRMGLLWLRKKNLKIGYL